MQENYVIKGGIFLARKEKMDLIKRACHNIKKYAKEMHIEYTGFFNLHQSDKNYNAMLLKIYSENLKINKEIDRIIQSEVLNEKSNCKI